MLIELEPGPFPPPSPAIPRAANQDEGGYSHRSVDSAQRQAELQAYQKEALNLQFKKNDQATKFLRPAIEENNWAEVTLLKWEIRKAQLVWRP